MKISILDIATLGDDLNLVSQNYDKLILDMSSGITNSTKVLAGMSQSAIVICNDNPQSIIDNYEMIKIMSARYPNTSLSIVINQVNYIEDGLRTYKMLKKACSEFLKITPPLRGIIRQDTRVRDSIRNQSTIISRYPESEAALDIMGEEKAQFLILHPPYDDIIKFSDKKEDLSNCESTEEFYDLFEKVAKNGYDKLEKGRFAALIIGDSYKNSEVQPLGFECMARMQKLGFALKAIIVKDMQGNERAKGKTANLWRYRALAGGFYIFKHEYVMVFQKR